MRHEDISKLAGWETASGEFRSELARLAKLFLLHAEIDDPTPAGIPPAFFGLVYALNLHADLLSGDAYLRAAAKPIWVQALLRRTGEDGESSSCLIVLTKAVPTIVRLGCEQEFRAIWGRDDLFYREFLNEAWSPQMEDALACVLEDSPLQPNSYVNGISLLQKHNPAKAKELARARLREHASEQDSPSRRAAIAVCLFIINDLWKEAWPIFIGNPAAARQTFLESHRSLGRSDEEKRIERMTTECLAEFYKILLKLFPISEKPWHEGARFLGPIDEIYDLQSTIKNALEQRGAYRELESAFEAYPAWRNDWWAKNSLERAKMNAHAQRRVAPKAGEFIAFLVTEGGVFVRDNNTLQNALLASLRRYEQDLRPDGINNLWEENPPRSPRSEMMLRNDIARHLQRDLGEKVIGVYMEVKAARKEGMDILVVAFPYSVTIEVKLAHGSDGKRPVLKSMEIQLRDKYLAETHSTHGIYVVGWYFCEAYPQRRLLKLKSVAEAQKYFDAQAQRLSVEEFVLKASVLDCTLRQSIDACSRSERLEKQSSRKGKKR